MELYARNMFFRGDTEKDQVYDYCIHGKMVFKIGDELLSDDAEWCVSASAYRFLHALFKNHFMGSEDFLIPCCGHTMFPSDDKNSVSIFGCNNGIDFDIIHEQENVIIKTADSRIFKITFNEFKDSVLVLAKQVEDFYKANPPRKFGNDFDKDSYSAFMTEWFTLYDKALALSKEYPKIIPISFDDYDSCTENEIIHISKDGISLASFRFINFKECAYNFQQTEGGSGKCVGERESTDFSFTFYTAPKPIMIKFIERNKFVEFITKKNTMARFQKLQNQIAKYGYNTRDRS